MLPAQDLHKEQEHMKHEGLLFQFVCQCCWNKYRVGFHSHQLQLAIREIGMSMHRLNNEHLFPVSKLSSSGSGLSLAISVVPPLPLAPLLTADGTNSCANAYSKSTEHGFSPKQQEGRL